MILPQSQFQCWRKQYFNTLDLHLQPNWYGMLTKKCSCLTPLRQGLWQSGSTSWLSRKKRQLNTWVADLLKVCTCTLVSQPWTRLKRLQQHSKPVKNRETCTAHEESMCSPSGHWKPGPGRWWLEGLNFYTAHVLYILYMIFHINCTKPYNPWRTSFLSED